MKFLTENLSKHHLRDKFDCGIESLNNYLKHQANQDIKKRLAMCFVISNEPIDSTIKGYYTLSNSSISREYIPEEIQKKFPKAYKAIPTTLLGRLARDQKYAYEGIGEQLLIDALYRSYLASQELGSFAVIVDPINEFAEQFYASYGFVKLQNSKKMFLAMKTVSEIF
jgi:hypothetical protein